VFRLHQLRDADPRGMNGFGSGGDCHIMVVG
jgi:hypothetical protein